MRIGWLTRVVASCDMRVELQNFLEAPTARGYRRVRDALRDEAFADCPAGELAGLAALSTAGEHLAVLERYDQMQPAWSLSPRVHFYAALAADHLGDEATAELERFVFQACLEGILATGDGSAEAPYLITYLSDEYDVLTALGLAPRAQSLVDRRGLLCDVVKCVDGAEVWFELGGLVHDPRQVRLETAGRAWN
jgi:hypothetical protein